MGLRFGPPQAALSPTGRDPVGFGRRNRAGRTMQGSGREVEGRFGGPERYTALPWVESAVLRGFGPVLRGPQAKRHRTYDEEVPDQNAAGCVIKLREDHGGAS